MKYPDFYLIPTKYFYERNDTSTLRRFMKLRKHEISEMS